MTEQQKKERVWRRGFAIPGYDPAVWRRDNDGNAICFAEYGNEGSVYGWKFGRTGPATESDGEDVRDLRPVHCGKPRAAGPKGTP